MSIETKVGEVAYDFVRHYTAGGGCSHCGGLPHSTECFVGRMVVALGRDSIDSGVTLIAKERRRQIDRERWSGRHDDGHRYGELRDAAICYAMVCDDDGAGENAKDLWPWDEEWWKPSDDPIRNLTKSGALIAAEIDRLRRLESNVKRAIASGQ